MDSDHVDAFQDLEALKRVTIPDMDGRLLAELTCGNEASIDVGDCAADNFLFVLHVEPLLAYVRVEQYHHIGHKVHHLFVHELLHLFILVDLASGLRLHASHQVLHGPLAV